MNSPAFDIKDILEASGESSGYDDLIFEGKGQNVIVGREPSTPVICVTIFDTPGYAPDLGLTSKGYERPSIQIRVRNTHQMTGWAIAERIKDSLHGLAQITVNGTLYSVIRCTSGPVLLDFDDNGNSRHIINFDVQRRPA
jgi:hypothetical protein